MQPTFTSASLRAGFSSEGPRLDICHTSNVPASYITVSHLKCPNTCARTGTVRVAVVISHPRQSVGPRRGIARFRHQHRAKPPRFGLCQPHNIYPAGAERTSSDSRVLFVVEAFLEIFILFHTTSMTSSKITLIDLPTREPAKCWSPNSWKSTLHLGRYPKAKRNR